MLAEIDTRAVQTSMVQCANGMDAFVALPSGPGPYRAIVQLHERYGLVQHTKDLATRFASEGFAVIAPNLFFRDPNQDEIARGDAPGTHNDDQVAADTAVAIGRLREIPGVERDRFISMGVCATGRYPLVISARSNDVEACVIFYGKPGLANDGQEQVTELIARSRAPIVGIFGELDHSVSIEHVLQLRNGCDAARRSYHIRVYRDAPHGFLNDTMPGRYRRSQAEDSWRLVGAFLAGVRDGRYAPDRVQWTFESDISTSYDFTKNVRME